MSDLPDVKPWEHETGENPFRWGTSYSAMIDTMDLEELVEVSDDDYQGDTFTLVSKGEKYGLLIYGWGSCSGCDAAQAVTTLSEANKLRDQLYDGIHWFDTLGEAATYIASDDKELQWYGYRETYRKFVAQVEQYLRDKVADDAEMTAAITTIQESITKWAQEGW